MVSLKRLKQLMEEQGEDKLILVEGDDVFVLKRLESEASDPEDIMFEFDEHDEAVWHEEGDTDSGDTQNPLAALEGFTKMFTNPQGETAPSDEDLFESVSEPADFATEDAEQDGDWEDELVTESTPAAPIHDILEQHAPQYGNLDDGPAPWEIESENPVTYEEFPEENPQR